ncbi:MAG: hypothetical protein ACFFD2_23945 [Promethearchaeota archaeon]
MRYKKQLRISLLGFFIILFVCTLILIPIKQIDNSVQAETPSIPFNIFNGATFLLDDTSQNDSYAGSGDNTYST